ncbi:hypothetical protein GNP63_04600 [Aliivibrio fischeri]|uniref:hypothetical protein n=1 Tax=Aliivibrio fischeri TaxID=668 RepID=UPI0012D939F3|nr:hypothetical protein [Aliivibrio fischeri]MUH95837.1 hypothetical protein [Aliivibrio fischeri]MUI62884.1 hypothetical protein [Aliivibrio fischeri]
MNIQDFILTAVFSGLTGLIIGYFLRDLLSLFWRFYTTKIRQPKHLIQYHFEDIQDHSSPTAARKGSSK